MRGTGVEGWVGELNSGDARLAGPNSIPLASEIMRVQYHVIKSSIVDPRHHPVQGAQNRITLLHGINDAGQLSGVYHPNGTDSPARIFTAEGIEALPRTFPTPDQNMDPWVGGLDYSGVVFGQVTILHAPAHPEECGGHGHPHGTHCHCDSGYVQDPNDPGMCIPE